jgi:hypothetical protein
MKETSGRKRQELLEDEITYLRSEIEEAVRMLAGVQAIVEEGRDIIAKSPPAERLLADLHTFLHKHESAPRKQLWCVHVEGPNHAVPAPDQATAAKWAGYINEAARQYFARSGSPQRLAIRAKPALWPHSAADHALGPSEEYGWLLRVKPQR